VTIRELLTCPAVALMLAAAGVACDRPVPQETAHDDEHDHAAGEVEVSDLDRPLADLFADDCEHAVKAFACDECRYEVGVARVPAHLIAGGLVGTAPVEPRAVDVPVVLTGEVRFDERRVGHVSALADGVVTAVHVVLGDRVRQGQPLVTLDCAAVGEAQAEYLAARGLLELARRNFERVSSLREEAIAAEKEFLLAQQEHEAAQIRAAGALAGLARYGVAAADARALAEGDVRGRLTLRAPLGGAVLAMHAVPGELAGSDAPLLTIGDRATVWVWADLYEGDLAAVSRAQAAGALAAAVAVAAYPDEVFAGVVDLVSPSMEESSRTVKVRIAVPNPDGRLLAGMFADVRLFLPGTATALAVPTAAVLADEGREFVFVHHHDEYYVRRPVTAGRAAGGWTEILAGLTTAQTVATEGAFLLKSDVLRAKMGAGCAD
jgi:cobalt-zinc-cadmium efflux system membrane fusion protein